jgi:UDP-glucose 4-epimerase
MKSNHFSIPGGCKSAGLHRKKLLVVGGAGYIGSHVVLELLQRNKDVVVLDNLSTGSRENLPEDIAFVLGDYGNAELLRQVLESHAFEAVFHFGALKAAGESMTDPSRYAMQNIGSTLVLLDQVLHFGNPKVIFSSTAAVYGSPVYLPVDEDHPCAPINFYGRTKGMIEEILDWYGRLKGLRFAALRYFNAAGFDGSGRIRGLERNPQNLIPLVMEARLGLRPQLQVFGDDYPTSDGSCIRDYIHVTDLADAHVRALNYLDHHERLVCNLGTGRGSSVFEVLQACASVSGQGVPHEVIGRRAGDPASLTASYQKAKECLGWEPLHSELHRIMEDTWNIYRTVHS